MLSFELGDIIIIDEQNDSGWWKGTLEKTGAKGEFKANYVEIFSDGDEEEEKRNSFKHQQQPPMGFRVTQEDLNRPFKSINLDIDSLQNIPKPIQESTFFFSSFLISYFFSFFPPFFFLFFSLFFSLLFCFFFFLKKIN